MYARLLVLFALAALATAPQKAHAYYFCKDLSNRVEKIWPTASGPLPQKYRCFADTTRVRVYDRSHDGVEKTIASIAPGDIVLSMAYVARAGQVQMVPCWDSVTKTHHSPRPENIQSVSIDVGPTTEYRFYSFTAPEHPFLVERAVREAREGELDLIWVPARDLRFSNLLVSLENARSGEMPSSKDRRATAVYGSESRRPESADFALAGSRISKMVTLTTELTHTFFVKGHYYPDARNAGNCAFYLVHNKF